MNSLSRIYNLLLRRFNIKSFERFERIFALFSLAEKTILGIATVVLALSTLSILAKINNEFLVEIPSRGGTIHEGIIGTPRFINPLLALSDADRDLTSLVYSGLLRALPEGGFVPDLAESYTVSSDGLVYTFVIRPDAIFHDGTPVTVEDVEFTVLKDQDGSLKSPRRVNWESVTVERVNTYEIKFTLKQPYSLFIANATIGILPKHIWKTLENDQFPFSQFNVEPIGSGPYKIDKVSRSNGIPTSYVLSANERYTLGRPYIDTFEFTFFTNENGLVSALRQGIIDSASNLSAETYLDLEKSNVRLLRAPLTRIFGVFFNQNQNELLAHKEIRQALDKAIDKNEIVRQVLLGSGTVIDGPLPPAVSGKIPTPNKMSTSTIDDILASIKKSGWTRENATSTLSYSAARSKTKTPLSLSLVTSNVPELIETARMVESTWKNMGVDINVKVFEPSDLNQNIIRPRKYDVLLFGMVVGRDPDLYAFWHSSQRNDPGLNIALYTNTKADKALEEMRRTMDSNDRALFYEMFNHEIASDAPAIFLYSPDFIYAVPEKVKNVRLGQITTPNDRFLSVNEWFIETDNVWGFVKNMIGQKKTK